jgi:hypothetical protein
MLTMTYSGRSATDPSYLLHKHPARIHATELAFGNAHVFILSERPTVARPHW